MNLITGRREYFSVQNYETVYNDVQQTWQDPDRALRLHWAAAHLLHPTIHFGDGVAERLEQTLDDGGQAAIALDHASGLDPLQVAAMAELSPVFHRMRGFTMIGAKVGIHMLPLVGDFVPDLGSIPIWRRQDIPTAGLTSEQQAELELIRKMAGEAFIQTEIIGMNQGRHMVKHVPGTRKRDDPTKLQTVYSGFGKVVSGVDQDRDILIMTGAFYYGNRSLREMRRPTIYLDIPENQDRSSADEVTKTIAPGIQHCLDMAVELHSLPRAT